MMAWKFGYIGNELCGDRRMPFKVLQNSKMLDS